MTVIPTGKAPAVIGPCSQAIRHGDLSFASGHMSIDPETGAFNTDNAVEQSGGAKVIAISEGRPE